MIGKEFLKLLPSILTDQFNVQWKLKRTIEKNQLFRIQGIVIVGKLTNKVLGEVLMKNVNLIITTPTAPETRLHRSLRSARNDAVVIAPQ